VCMKLITRTYRYKIHDSGSQVAPIAADEGGILTVLSCGPEQAHEAWQLR
jgi:hypothetical protein